ncbi:MAG: ribosomal-processing cysteine protease Prp [Leptospira sp.]|nr:ribosomal-processing cysteine protease Prp [Leptospira sp.]
MIEISIEETNGNYRGIKIEGHAPEDFGKNGNNILCAAVSVLGQTLHLHLRKKDLVSEEKIEKGFLQFRISDQQQESANSAFEVIIGGLRNLEAQYPEEIRIQTT